MAGEFSARLSLRTVDPNAPWLVEAVHVDMGETRDQHQLETSQQASRRFVCLPSQQQVISVRQLLTTVLASGDSKTGEWRQCTLDFNCFSFL